MLSIGDSKETSAEDSSVILVSISNSCISVLVDVDRISSTTYIVLYIRIIAMYNYLNFLL